MWQRKTYNHRHRVMLEETNLVGNVYFSNYFLWQGHCREMFLTEHAPGVMAALHDDLALVTAASRCDFFAELFAGDEVEVRMSLGRREPGRITMLFDYYRMDGTAAQLAARGEQTIACMRRVRGVMEPTEVPEELTTALRPYEREPILAVAKRD
ncbi:acyl-CoA thioesterase [Streptomyces melanogenes]|uniref:acyl-CoA thioesterase n=1 Tax=Streptomyces melanogenes TaxID=67326 RepID=UPI00167CA548|nr:acyl-CoA thioesterase [Streptomyces melanogenes]GGP92461.1 4-hydroxybenzoyl-CoA thioesterase [Streptomyces melanogenes]